MDIAPGGHMKGWMQAAAGGLGGAVLALALVFAGARAGLFPASNAAIHDYLMSHPDILIDMTNKLQADQADAEERERQAAVDKVGLKAYFDPRIAFITGPANARTTMVEFFDYNCPYCRGSLPVVKKYYEAHKGDTRFAFIEFPIKGPASSVAARAAIAARKQPDKYLAFHFLLMGETDLVDEDLLFDDARKAGLDVNKLKADMETASVGMEIAAAHTLAEASKIDGTPAFIVNGKVHEGLLQQKTLDKLLKS
ncbi:MAG TPA: thioredoxin domain-containing protein [Rhizomicrobium sp.]|nr:thioredoxin domain-containing protein [Rhizomicrobium sp.]